MNSEAIKPKVFTPNYAGQPLHNAADFGTVVPITEGNINLFDINRLEYIFETFLEDHGFDPKTDYIILAGHVILSFVLSKVITEKYSEQYDYINLLLFQSAKKEYMLRELYFRKE